MGYRTHSRGAFLRRMLQRLEAAADQRSGKSLTWPWLGHSAFTKGMMPRVKVKTVTLWVWSPPEQLNIFF